MVATSRHLPFLFPLLLAVSPCTAQDWPHWRGPSYNGSTAAKDLPVEFSRPEVAKILMAHYQATK